MLHKSFRIRDWELTIWKMHSMLDIRVRIFYSTSIVKEGRTQNHTAGEKSASGVIHSVSIVSLLTDAPLNSPSHNEIIPGIPTTKHKTASPSR